MKLLKKEVREQVLYLRRTIDRDEMKELSTSIQLRLIESEFFKKANVVFVYINTPEEISTKEIIKTGKIQHKEILVPTITGKGMMKPCVISKDTKFETNRFGILEPGQKTFYEGDIDLAVIPALAVDRSGYRVGYGGGYYDRFFAQKKGGLKIALCLEQFFFQDNKIAVREYDVGVDGVITEKRLVLFTK